MLLFQFRKSAILLFKKYGIHFCYLMGVFLLSERFTRIEVLAYCLLFRVHLSLVIAKMQLLNLFSVEFRSYVDFYTFYGVRTITAKKHIHELSPTMLSINRAIFLLFLQASCSLSSARTVYSNQRTDHDYHRFIFRPFLTSLSQYSALIYLDASRSAIVQSTQHCLFCSVLILFSDAFR